MLSDPEMGCPNDAAMGGREDTPQRTLFNYPIQEVRSFAEMKDARSSKGVKVTPKHRAGEKRSGGWVKKSERAPFSWKQRRRPRTDAGEKNEEHHRDVSFDV